MSITPQDIAQEYAHGHADPEAVQHVIDVLVEKHGLDRAGLTPQTVLPTPVALSATRTVLQPET